MTHPTPIEIESPTSKVALRASHVCPIESPTLDDGVVAIEQGVIQFVGAASNFDLRGFEFHDLGDGAIIPGLVNAHTHLEFSDLESPLGTPGIKFTDWIRLVVKSRIDSNDQPAQKKRRAIQSGIEESLNSGVVAIGEIATFPFDTGDYQSANNSKPGLAGILICLEQLGSDVSTFDEKRKQLAEFLSSKPGSPQQTHGASPHAPYSCHPKLVEQILDVVNESQVVAMHLAETLEERELLENQSGDFVDLLKEFGVWNPEAFPQKRTIKSIVERLSHKDLIIHGNYLTDSELDLIQFMQMHGDRITIIFCPRTHKYFGHSKYPLKQMMNRSIRVAVGTDSRASNPDLDLFEELKLIRSSFPDVSAQEIIKMGTLNGAEALGMPSIGSLAPQKLGMMNFVAQTDATSGDDLEDWLLCDDAKCQPIRL